jgi:oligopeptide transport system permease protein
MGTLITSTVLMIPGIIRSEATLAYLGLGLKGTASFGVILSENQTLLSSRGYIVIFPDVILALLMITFNLFGNGLRDAFNPTLKGSE